jgi:hypothetical protein
MSMSRDEIEKAQRDLKEWKAQQKREADARMLKANQDAADKARSAFRRK